MYITRRSRWGSESFTAKKKRLIECPRISIVFNCETECSDAPILHLEVIQSYLALRNGAFRCFLVGVGAPDLNAEYVRLDELV